jgi:hypothetical protein
LVGHFGYSVLSQIASTIRNAADNEKQIQTAAFRPYTRRMPAIGYMAKVARLSQLTEDELVEAAIGFANVRFKEHRRKASAHGVTSKLHRVHLRLPYRRLPIDRSSLESDEVIRGAHTWLCDALKLIVRDSKELAPSAASKVMALFTERATRWLEDVELHPFVDKEQRRPKRHVSVRSVGSLCAYAIALIVERGYFIRRCKPPQDGVDLMPCKNLFWAKNNGGRYSEHCPQHRKSRKSVK